MVETIDRIVLNNFDGQTHPGILLDEGCRGEVYDIAPGIVAKSYYSRKVSGPLAEFDIAKTLYEEGVQCPKPHGVFNITLKNGNDPVPGFVMDRINGIQPKQIIDIEEYKDALKQIATEKRKIERIGFFPSLEHSIGCNTLWVPEEKKLYLFDFDSLIRRDSK